MTEFVEQLRHRVRNALVDLEQARAAGDDYSVQIHTSDLQSIARLAQSHGVRLRELEQFRAA